MRSALSTTLLVLLLPAAIAIAQEVVPPRVLERVDAVYPASVAVATKESVVTLFVTVGTNGAVAEVKVAESGGDEFDRAAMSAALQWRFAPATRDGKPILARIRVPFRFSASAGATESPVPSVTPGGTPAAAPTPQPLASIVPVATATPAPMPRAGSEPGELTVEVRGKRPPPPVAISDFVLPEEILTAAPHRDSGSLLNSAPGVYATRPEGDAVAHEIFLRGFDAEHGQDIELSAGGVPINQPSQIHGQGYADLNFIIPEVVRSVRVTEGVYDPRQGDFATAGSVDFDLGVSHRGYLASYTQGTFGTTRQLLLWAPEKEAEETFGAIEIRQTQGYGQNRGGSSAAGMGQYAFELPAGFKGLASLSAFGARANLAGVLRLDDVNAGKVGFYDSYPDPTANAQSAFSSKLQAAMTIERATESGARDGIVAWLQQNGFHLRENFTGYTQFSRVLYGVAGRGDLVEQQNADDAIGAKAFHRTPRIELGSRISGNVEAGVSFRSDQVNQLENLLQQPENEIWDKRVDATIFQSDLGGYVDADFRLWRVLHLRGGYRADTLYFDVDDRLGNSIPKVGQQNHIIGYTRTALGIASGPRGTVEVDALPWLTAIASYGEGYRSPQARQLEEGENAPFAKVRAYEGGVRVKPGDGNRLEVTTAAYSTSLSSDLAFDPQSNSLEFIGPTTRRGAVMNVITRPVHGLFGGFSATYVHATLDKPPFATPDNPNPQFARGELLPYVPPWVLRADLGGDVHVDARNAPLSAHLGLGASYLSARPLPFGQFSAPVSLFDLTGSLRWRWAELSFDVLNLLDKRYAAEEFSFVSNWNASGTPSLIPARHIVAGPPRTVLTTLSLHF